jgi:hypothetical protein
MNLIKTDLQSILPDLTWDDFTLEGDVYVTKYVPVFEDEDKHNRFLRLRDKYPSEYAAALVSKLPEGATLQSYDHLQLKLIVTRA